MGLQAGCRRTRLHVDERLPYERAAAHAGGEARGDVAEALPDTLLARRAAAAVVDEAVEQLHRQQ